MIEISHPRVAFSATGVFSRVPGFETRPSQVEMASVIWELLKKGGYALIEAGTGTGKSLAYLYPAFFSSRKKEDPEENEHLVISTHTINLQQQLIEKEIPFLARTTGYNLRYSLLMGRGNYLCRRKVEFLRRTMGENAERFPLEEKRVFARLLKSIRDDRGCLEQLGFNLPGGLREMLVSEAETCLRKYCPFQKDCFWLAARRQAFESQVVVVNHHLFFADLAVRRNREFSDERLILPPYQYVVFDEAHHLPDVAAEYLGLRLDEIELLRFFDRLLRKEGRFGRGRLISLRQRLLEKGTDLAFLQNTLALLESKVIPDLIALEEAILEFFTALRAENNLSPHFSGEDVNYRFTTNLQQEKDLLRKESERVLTLAENWQKELSLLVDEFQDQDDFLEDAVFLAEAARYVSQLRLDLPLLMDGTEEKYVHWISVANGGEGRIRTVINRVPLFIGELLYQSFFTQVKSAVCTSATLSVGEDFAFIRDRLGMDYLHPSERTEVLLESPFAYDRQVLVLSSGDLPSPDDPGFFEGACRLLPEVINASGGRTLILFTNQRQMREIYTRLAPELKNMGYNLFLQGEEPRHRLLAKFKSSLRPVLFGMDSFWEGVDIPGPQLSTVVLMRLPFRVPTDPLFQAKWEALLREGKDPFLTLSLPEAVIKFKQGFGRLIRTENDRGTVVVLDKRLCTRPYGKIFLASIPGGRIIKTAPERIPAEISSWLAIEK